MRASYERAQAVHGACVERHTHVYLTCEQLSAPVANCFPANATMAWQSIPLFVPKTSPRRMHAVTHVATEHNLSLLSLARLSPSQTLGSRRLGNLASAWWFGQQRHRRDWFQEIEAKAAGGGELAQYEKVRQLQFASTSCQGDACLGAHLTRPGARVTQLSDACLQQVELIWISPHVAEHFWVTPHKLYATRLLTACAGQLARTMGEDLRRELVVKGRQRFAALERASTKATDDRYHVEPLAANYCIVHYRVGDRACSWTHSPHSTLRVAIA